MWVGDRWQTLIGFLGNFGGDYLHYKSCPVCDTERSHIWLFCFDSKKLQRLIPVFGVQKIRVFHVHGVLRTNLRHSQASIYAKPMRHGEYTMLCMCVRFQIAQFKGNYWNERVQRTQLLKAVVVHWSKRERKRKWSTFTYFHNWKKNTWHKHWEYHARWFPCVRIARHLFVFCVFRCYNKTLPKWPFCWLCAFVAAILYINNAAKLFPHL